MTGRLPHEMRDALLQMAAGNRSALLNALQVLESRRLGLGWLSFWQVARATESPERMRALTFAIAGSTRKDTALLRESPHEERFNSFRESVRIWALGLPNADLSTNINLLTGLEFSLDLPDGLPRVLATSILPFLLRCLEHEEAIVRHGVLDFLVIAQDRAQLDRFLHRAAATALAESIIKSLERTLEDEEVTTAETLSGSLRDESLPIAPVVAPRALQRLVLDLDDTSAMVADELDDIDELLETLRRRSLLDDAGKEAQRHRTSLNTIRVKSDAPLSALVNALLRIVRTAIHLRASSDNEGDIGMRLLAAPSASFPIHIALSDDDADIAFETLSEVFSLTGRVQAAGVIEQMEPSLARAALTLLTQAAASGGEVEIALTKPSTAEWQRTLSTDLSTVPQDIFDLLAQRARGKGSGQGIIVDRLMVPQANTVRLVFQAVDAMLTKGIVSISDIENISNQRQVDYYRQGARVLGLFDENNEPTQRARSMIGLDEEQRLRLAAVYFEDSEIGRAWRQWAGVDQLIDLDPNTAEAFLKQCVIGLTGTTLPRRASSLRRWHAELSPYHYSKKSTDNK